MNMVSQEVTQLEEEIEGMRDDIYAFGCKDLVPWDDIREDFNTIELCEYKGMKAALECKKMLYVDMLEKYKKLEKEVEFYYNNETGMLELYIWGIYLFVAKSHINMTHYPNVSEKCYTKIPLNKIPSFFKKIMRERDKDISEE